MKTNLLTTTALIVGLGLFGPYTGAIASVGSQSLKRTEQISTVVLAMETQQPELDQNLQSPENLRRKLQQDAQQQQNILERQRQEVFERQRQRDAQQQQNILERQRQQDAQQQRQLLQKQYERQIANRRNREAQYTRQLVRQRLAWQQDRNRKRNNWLQQQRLIERERRLERINARHRTLYRNYVTYYNRDYWEDIAWRNRNYWNDRTFWSGPGYWYERDYWSQRGYIWDDILGTILQGLISGLVQEAISSTFTPYPPASILYSQGPQILSYNGLTQAACEPGNIVILLPNRRVMCAVPTYSFAPGTYRIGSPGLTLIPAEIQY